MDYYVFVNEHVYNVFYNDPWALNGEFKRCIYRPHEEKIYEKDNHVTLIEDYRDLVGYSGTVYLTREFDESGLLSHELNFLKLISTDIISLREHNANTKE